MAISTSKVQGRRTLKFSSLQDVLADAERMSAGNVKALGSPAGQIFQHLAKSLNDSIDGSDARFPWYLTVPARSMKKKPINGSMPPGFKLPGRGGQGPRTRTDIHRGGPVGTSECDRPRATRSQASQQSGVRSSRSRRNGPRSSWRMQLYT